LFHCSLLMSDPSRSFLSELFFRLLLPPSVVVVDLHLPVVTPFPVPRGFYRFPPPATRCVPIFPTASAPAHPGRFRYRFFALHAPRSFHFFFPVAPPPPHPSLSGRFLGQIHPPIVACCPCAFIFGSKDPPFGWAVFFDVIANFPR